MTPDAHAPGTTSQSPTLFARMALAIIVVVSGVAYTTAHATASPVFNVTAAPYGADATGHADATLALRAAINDAENAAPMATVFIPAGTYKLDVVDGANIETDLVAKGPNPIVIQGAGAAGTTLVEYVGAANPAVCAAGSADAGLCSPCRNAAVASCFLKNLLALREDGSKVEDLTLDTRTYDAGSALQVVANNTTVSSVIVTHGAAQNALPHFPVYYGGQPGSSQGSPLYHDGNVINGLVSTDNECDDGISFSFQQNATINNLSYTGSRLALYVDDNVAVTNFTFTPGAQTCDTRQGFWITSPSQAIQITNYKDVAAAGSAAGGGVVGTTTPTAAYATTGVTLSGYQVGPSAEATLHLANASNVAIGPGPTTCSLTGTNRLKLEPTNGVEVTNVQVIGCQISWVVLAPQTSNSIRGLVFTSDTFAPEATQHAILNDVTKVPMQVTVSGGQLSEGCGQTTPLSGSQAALQLIVGTVGLPVSSSRC